MSELRVSWPVLELQDGRKSLDAEAFVRAATLAATPRTRPPSVEPVYVLAPDEQRRTWLLVIPAGVALVAAAVLAFV